jgi:hypothetical protein
LVAYEGHVSLQSSRLYRTLPSGIIQTETIKKSYLPTAYIQQLEKEQTHKAGEKVIYNIAINRKTELTFSVLLSEITIWRLCSK